jgi:FAD/FMN-containing dehydrogenase/Fe-S oxidoreductase
VQPGVVLDDLNRELRPLGLQFAPDISTSNRATIGGMVANNSSGTHSVIHGKTIDHVLGLHVLLTDGTVVEAGPLTDTALRAKCTQKNLEGECYRVVRRLAQAHEKEIERRFPKILRRVGGYNLDLFTPASPCNLAYLLVGSEGTLAVTLEAKLRLIELPRAKALLVLHFAELLDALGATPAILEHGPAAVEVIDRYVLDSTKLNPEASRLRDFLHGDPGAILLVEFYGARPEDLAPKLDALVAALQKRRIDCYVHRAPDNAAQGRAWKLRKLALGLSMAEKGDAKAISFVEDTAVAPENLRDYIAEFLTIIKKHGTSAGVYAHASVGCLHVRPIVNLKTAEGVRKFEAIAGEVAELVLKYGGALSGEHGDGLVRSPFQEKMFGPVLYNAFREIKRTFDPLGILNPGKIVDAPPLSSQLRYGPTYVTPEVPTTFDFSADGGLARAAELCAGVGECRKKREGTMCPSYQATREEQHSTRGRANALRLALTGQMQLQGLTDPALKEALDLCLECKACKSECPTNVDMARLKAEFLHQYYREHGVPWRNRVFGHVATLSKWGRRLAPVSNWIAQGRLSRWLNEKLLGIDRRRVPPAFARQTFFQQYYRGDLSLAQDVDVLLFPDTFVNFHEPHVGLAAVQALQSLGGHPSLGEPRQPFGYPPFTCCGRPLISNGLLDQAVEHAQHNVAYLHPWAAAGKPIIACEPSCILTIKDDYPALLRGEWQAKAKAVAAACLTFAEHCEQIMASGGREPPDGTTLIRGLTPPARRILVQAHCHQRSLVGVGSLLKLLRRIPGAEVLDADAGCCGMAGSFGYEKEHYEISRQIGEERLFPAIRKLGPEDVIVAPGFSCRMQIEHFTGRKALHPAELLANLVSR